MSRCVEQLRYFLCALAYFTRLPIPAWVGYRADDLNHAAKFFPLVGVVVGGIGALVWYAASFVFPERVALLASMIATVWLTGAFHEDGLADAIDGFGGGYTRADTLRIMQDSRIGSFGAVSLVLGLLLKFELLASLAPDLLPFAMLAGHGASRFAAAAFLFTLDYVRPEGKAKPVATRMSGTALLCAAVVGLAPVFYFELERVALILIVLLALHGLLGRYFKRRLGGYTGDALGMAQQLFELGIYGALATWISI